MKKLLFAFMGMFLIAGTATAQDSPKKMLKNAKKAMTKYTKNMVENAAMLDEAKSLLDMAFKSGDAANDAELLLKKAEIFDLLAKSESTQAQLEPTFKPSTPDAALTAFNTYQKVAGGSDKGKVKKALKALQTNIQYLNNAAAYAYNAKDYANAFKLYKSSVDAQKILSDNGKESILDDPTAKNDNLFYGAVAAYLGGMKSDSKPLFKQLYTDKYDHAMVYEALFNITSEEGGDGLEYITAGRERYPDDTSLLFAEINYYLKSGQLETLIEKLKAAIEKEPENVSVYNVMGNTYDQLFQQKMKEGDEAKAKEYFDLAKDYYTQALGIDAKNFDATYSIGALYYNKGASYTDKLNALSEDYSKAGIKKYDAMKAEQDLQFDTATPYFIKAEEIDPKQVNPLIALREIYARANKLDKVEEYKGKLAALGM